MALDRLAGGWSSIGNWLCENCVVAPALKQVVQDRSVDEARCDYCGSASTDDLAVADSNHVLDHIVQGLRTEYDEAVDVLFWDEGAYVGTTWDSQDVQTLDSVEAYELS